MILILESKNFADYLTSSEIIDYNAPQIRSLARRLSEGCTDAIEEAKSIYEYVRDQVAHSGDIRASYATCSASEVLVHGHGICCAKSHLLAALLRARRIPAGFCYQWLTSDDKPEELVLHGLNAVYLDPIKRWIRLDARGNKPGVQAEFSLEKEKLAWPVQEELGEVEDPVVYTDPKQEVVDVLQRYRNDRQWLYRKK